MGGVGLEGERKMGGVGAGKVVGRKEMEVMGQELKEREI